MSFSNTGYAIETFSNGINQSKKETLIDSLDAYKACNCNISKGTLKRSKGSTLYSTPASLTTPQKLMKLYHGATETLLGVYNKKVYKINGNTGTAIDALTYNNSDFDFVNYQYKDIEVIIYTNGYDNVKMYDGTTVRNLKMKGTASADASDNVSPIGKYITLNGERIWLAKDNTLYFSTAYDPDDWTVPLTEEQANQHGGSIEIPTWDGGFIVGLRAMFDSVIVFKKKNVFRVAGTYPGDFAVTQIFNTINGKIIENTIAGIHNKAIWLTTEGLHVFNGSDIADLRPRISEYFGLINQSAIDKAVGIIHDDKYILAVPSIVTNTNNLVIEYDMVNGNFMTRTGFDILSFIEFGDDLLYLSSDGKIYKYNVGETYNGTNIDSSWESGFYNAGATNAVKLFNYVYFTGTGNGSVKVSIFTEKTLTTPVTVTIPLTSTQSVIKQRVRNKGRTFKVKIENINGADFEISSPQFMYELEFD